MSVAWNVQLHTLLWLTKTVMVELHVSTHK